MRDFTYLWFLTPGLFEDAAWTGVYNARAEYLLLPLRIHEESERLAQEKPTPVRFSENLPAEERKSLERYLESFQKVWPHKATYFDRIGTIVFGFALLERACQMATVVLNRHRIAVVPWLERSGSLTHKIETLLQRELQWQPSDDRLWRDLRALYALRNAFVHAGGYFDVRSPYGARVLATVRELGVGVTDLGFFVVDSGVDLVVGTFVEPTEAILERVADAVNSRNPPKTETKQ